MTESETIGLSVDETVQRLISNWPSLYPTRGEALRHVFTADDVSWHRGQHGHVAHPKDLESRDLRPWTPEEADAEVKDHAPLNAMSLADLAGHRITHRRHAAEVRFARENAHLLAIATPADFADRSPPRFTSGALNRIPAGDLAPAWTEALAEFCHAILAYPEARVEQAMHGQKAEDRAEAMTLLSTSKAVAEEALRRCGRSTTLEARLRRRRLDAIEKEAALFGYCIVPITPRQA